jgi:minor histocompatibility antigen H13
MAPSADSASTSSASVSSTPAATNPLLLGSYILLFLIWGLSNYILIPVSLNLITTSTLIIYIGSHRSLRLLIKGEHAVEKEVLTANEAYKFPFIGSASLFGLYLAFKYLDKYYVNLILSIYFSIIGVFTLTSTLAPFIKQFVTSTTVYGNKQYTLPLLGKVDLSLTTQELLALPPSIIFAYYYFVTKHYLLNNVLGISFCIQAIERISIGSYKIGAILLIGLFFYDIFWVFGTEVMVTVAKSFDGPIKLLFPRVFASGDIKAEFSLLGLGDIVIPGLFISLLLRLDAVQARIDCNAAEYISFYKPYFHANIIAYSLGLVATVLIMYYFKGENVLYSC